ncbi:MAG: 1,4-dihydroxy-2-naphthoate octaprenyltransferase, partial [Sphingobacteriales bacterium]
GDSIHGADSGERQGPKRAVQSGAISSAQMRIGMYITALLAFGSGIWLLWEAFGSTGLYYFAGFVVLGLFAIWASVSYTAGAKPYGYAGLGDVFVFLFFGPVGVLGTYFLQAKELAPYLWLPALSCGFLATGVLNVNNIRDIESDKAAGKKSIPVRIGAAKAKVYHWFLLALAYFSALAYVLLTSTDFYNFFIFAIAIGPFIRHGIAVQKGKTAAEIDPLLKQLALLTLVFVLVFGLFQILPARLAE